MKLKSLLISLPIFSLVIGHLPALAGRLEPTRGECLFFRNGRLEERQRCTYSGHSWAGGGGTVLEWEDGVRTAINFGVQGRGERPCPEVGVDGVCGEWGFRDAATLAPLDRRRAESNGIPTFRCVNVNNNSVCWR
ncbi:MAG: hypothetical protein P5681_20450 [Limnospira sp. PMC 894.15]|uniref:Uncharacterized protein n=1 Tax=Limnospira fusiformis PMC 851.14 TaxID=2219512 RepID=A0ABU9EU02_LIMFS|nr:MULTISPECIES: hypothetical protein [unclassified Limnospira]MDT9190165.1 hypothetical protein [Limnospira sp. PMC 894.15]MDT9236099.1 hypothetical protein [Limnospira sp. PMC 917.15]MDT9277108.1 hypothetical protein [Limnospira sp. PMC 737.11]